MDALFEAIELRNNGFRTDESAHSKGSRGRELASSRRKWRRREKEDLLRVRVSTVQNESHTSLTYTVHMESLNNAGYKQIYSS